MSRPSSNTNPLPKFVKPPMSMLCTTCENYVDLNQLQNHREAHRALNLFGYSDLTGTYNTKQLLKRRKDLINRVMKKKSETTWPREIDCIDKAYEFLRFRLSHGSSVTLSSMDATPNGSERCECLTPSNTTEYNCRLNCGQAVGIAQNQNCCWRLAMEDAFVMTEIQHKDLIFDCCGIFDGYNGSQAAELCSKEFKGVLIESLAEHVTNPCITSCSFDDEVKYAIKMSFRKLDSKLKDGKHELSHVRWSGCAACIILLIGYKLFVANAGDLSGFLVKADGSHQSITARHLLERQKKGKMATSDKSTFVEGPLTSTRGLGNHGDVRRKKAIKSKPDITTLSLNEKDQFVALYTQGISNVFSENEVMLLLEDILPETSEIGQLKFHYQKTGSTTEISTDNPNSNPLSYDGSDTNVRNTLDQSIANENDIVDTSNLSLSSHTNVNGKLNIITEEENEFYTASNRKVSFNSDEPVVCIERGTTMYTRTKASTLSVAMCKRIVDCALTAGSHENISTLIMLLKGCPINLYLLPSEAM